MADIELVSALWGQHEHAFLVDLWPIFFPGLTHPISLFIYLNPDFLFLLRRSIETVTCPVLCVTSQLNRIGGYHISAKGDLTLSPDAYK